MKTTCLLLFCATALVWSQRYSVTVDTGNCALSVNLFGGIGSTAPDTGIGDGFQYPKGTPSCLYCGAFLVANSESTVHDHFYGVPATQIHRDWVPSDTFVDVIPPLYGAHEMYLGSMVDSGSPTRSQGFKVYVMPAGRGAPLIEFDDFVIIRYDVWNKYGDTLNNVYVGVMLDFDVGASPTSNWGRTDASRRLTYMWPSSSNQNPCVGAKLLDPRTAANNSFIDHAIYVYPATGMPDRIKWLFLNGTIRLPNTTRAYDYSMCVSAGPFNLLRGQWVKVVFAIIGGYDSAGIKRHADSAQSWYDAEWSSKIEEEKSAALHNPKFRMTPNPAKRDVRLQMPEVRSQKTEVRLQIYDVSGKLIKELSVHCDKNYLHLDLADLSSGTYFVELKTGKTKSIQKLVVIR